MEEVAFCIKLDDWKLGIYARRFDGVELNLEISEERSDLESICNLFLSDYIFIGYDVQGTQSSIINSLIKNRQMIEAEKLTCMDIICEMNRLQYENDYGATPEEKYMGLFKFIDLKLLGGKGFAGLFSGQNIKEILDNTIEVYNKCYKYIQFVRTLAEKYKVGNINMYKHKFINKLVISKYCDILDIKESSIYKRNCKPIDRIFDNISQFTYKSTPISVAYKTKSRFVDVNQMRIDLTPDALKATKGKIFVSEESDDKVIILDATNFYPSVLIREQLYPLTLGHMYNIAFSSVFDELNNIDPLSYERKVLKDGLNAICGNLGNNSHILYDPFCKAQLFKRTKEYTLYLIDLCVQSKLEIIGVNTDAVFIKCKKSFDGISDIVNEYTARTSVKLHVENFNIFLFNDINNYVGSNDGVEITVKGDYFNKNKEIVNKLIKNEDIEKTKEFCAFIECIAPKQLKLF